MENVEELKNLMKDDVIEPLDKQIETIKIEDKFPFNGEVIDVSGPCQDWFDILGSGSLKKKILKKGDGPLIEQNTLCVLNITGYLSDNTIVEEYNHAEIVVGDYELIRGLDLAIPLMNLGEKCLIEVKARFAYGERGLQEPVPIPPNATIMYMVEILSASEPKPIDDLSLLERMEIGSKKRERGNWWIKRDEQTAAIACYRKALEFLDIPEKILEDLNPDHPGMKQLMEDRQKVLSNLATAQFNLKAYDASLMTIEGVLQYEPNNVKALYRKGKILSAQKLHTEAMSVFKEGLKLEPNNSLLKTEITRVESMHRKDEQQLKNLYMKMFLSQPSGKKITKKPSSSKSGRSMAAFLVGGVAAVAVAFVAFRYSTQFHD